MMEIYNIVSCFGEEKGIETTILASNLLKKDNIKFHIHIVGMDEHPQKKNYLYYLSLIKKYRLEDYIIFEGQKTNEEVANILDMADIIVDSRYVGNYSTVILEALAKGKAVIASSVKGNQEFIEDEINGLLYKIGDEADLAKKIENLIMDNQKIKFLEESAGKWFELNKNEYDFQNHCNELINVYESLMR